MTEQKNFKKLAKNIFSRKKIREMFNGAYSFNMNKIFIFLKRFM